MHANLPMASSSQYLLVLLRGGGISVPGRMAGGKTQHTESWTICRLLSKLRSVAANSAGSFSSRTGVRYAVMSSLLFRHFGHCQ